MDFQECVKTYGQNHPAAEHFEKSLAGVISTVLTYRHCAGAYVVDKNQVIAALGTVIIAIFTTILAVWTVSLAGSTRIAANAAKRSADAAVAIELPIIKAVPDNLGKGSFANQGIEKEYISVFSVTFSNLGRTKAFPVKLRYGFAVGALPKKPRYTFVEMYLFNDIFEADPKTRHPTTLSESKEIESGVWGRICASRVPVWFYCELAYLDFMQDRKREAAFCWRWQNVGIGMGWRPDDTPAYNR